MSLVLEDVGCTLGGRRLFHGVGVRCEPGTVTAIVGPNGSGKSTMLRIAAGLLPPNSGAARWNGRALAELPLEARARMLAYLPQHTPLLEDLITLDVVLLGRRPHLGPWRAPGAEDVVIATQALEEVGLAAFAARSLFSLSGGEFQRVMLARMLATEAPMLLLDEPTTALDVGHALAFIQRCRRLADAGRTVVLALHDLELARRWADQAIMLGDREGSAECGPAGDVLSAERVSRVFDVRARLGADGFVFEPRASADKAGDG